MKTIKITFNLLFCAMLSFSAYAQSPCLIHHYAFDGNTDDLTSNANHLTNNGATLTTDRNGNGNSAYKFSGGDYMTGDYDSLPVGDEDRTLSMWLYLEVNPDSDVPVVWGNTSQAGAYGVALGTNLDFKGSKAMRHFAWGQSHDHGFLIDYPLNEWFFLATTYDGDSAKTYLNGKLEAVAAKSWDTKPGFFRVGRNLNSNPNDDYEGSMDDIKIFGCALSDQQIDSMYRGQTAGIELFATDVKLYPNPASEVLHVECGADVELKYVEIYNGNGQLVLTTVPKDHSIKLGSLKGLHVVQLHTSKGVLRRKIVIL